MLYYKTPAVFFLVQNGGIGVLVHFRAGGGVSTQQGFLVQNGEFFKMHHNPQAKFLNGVCNKCILRTHRPGYSPNSHLSSSMRSNKAHMRTKKLPSTW